MLCGVSQIPPGAVKQSTPKCIRTRGTVMVPIASLHKPIRLYPSLLRVSSTKLDNLSNVPYPWIRRVRSWSSGTSRELRSSLSRPSTPTDSMSCRSPVTLGMRRRSVALRSRSQLVPAPTDLGVCGQFGHIPDELPLQFTVRIRTSLCTRGQDEPQRERRSQALSSA